MEQTATLRNTIQTDDFEFLISPHLNDIKKNSGRDIEKNYDIGKKARLLTYNFYLRGWIPFAKTEYKEERIKLFFEKQASKYDIICF